MVGPLPESASYKHILTVVYQASCYTIVGRTYLYISGFWTMGRVVRDESLQIPTNNLYKKIETVLFKESLPCSKLSFIFKSLMLEV